MARRLLLLLTLALIVGLAVQAPAKTDAPTASVGSRPSLDHSRPLRPPAKTFAPAATSFARWRGVTSAGRVYIMSGDMPGDALPFPGTSVTTASVVRTMAAIDAAFWSAERVTLAGSTIPNSNMSTYLSFRAS